jgi:hypothetical protein
MPRKARIQSIEVEVTAEGRFVVETYDDGNVVRRKVESAGTPRRKPRKPFVRVWRREDSTRTE